MRPEPLDVDALLRSSPGLVLVLRPDLTIAGASDAYLRATLARREDVVGRTMAAAFPDNPDTPEVTGVQNLDDSLRRVLLSGAEDTMPVQRHDVRDRFAVAGSWVEKHWTQVNWPVFGVGSGEIVCLLHRITDMTRTVLAGRTLDEQLRSNREQQDTLRDMYEALVVAEDHICRARREVACALAEGHAPPVPAAGDLEREAGASGAGEYLAPGDRAPVLGLYDVFHPAGCSHRMHELARFLAGETVPRCPGCERAVRFRHRPDVGRFWSP